MTKIDANGIGMELAFNPTNRHVQGVIFSKDNSHVDNSPNFSNFTSTQSVENNLDTNLGSIKTEPNFEPGEVIICKEEPHDWTSENSEAQDSAQRTGNTNGSFMLRHLLSENRQTESNIDSGLHDDLALEPGESLIRLKLEPEQISEIISENPLLESQKDLDTGLTNATDLSGAEDNLGDVNTNRPSPSSENANNSEVTSALQNVVPLLPSNRLVSSNTNIRENSNSRSQLKGMFQGTFIYRTIDAALSHLKYSSKVVYIKNVPFAVEQTTLIKKHGVTAPPFYTCCKTCGDSLFLDFDHFIDHLRHHRYSKMYCLICQKGMSGPIYAENHAELHTSNHVECNECFQFFPTKEKLKSHKLHHKGKPPFRCENCPTKFFLTFEQVKKHVRNCIDAVFKCNRCKLEFQSRNELEKHSCPAANLLECQKCLKIFETKEDLENHVKTTHKGVIRLNYDCKLPICQNSYGSYHQFLVHRVSHILEYTHKSKLKKCQICQKNFHSINQLREHVKRRHSQKQYHCEVCHLGYTRQKHVIHHLKVHELNYHQCHQCFYFYKTQCELRHHGRKHRMGPPFYCEHCPNVEFKCFNNIRAHVSKNHLNYKCEVCNKTFQLFFQLSVHKQTHEKRYSCKKCGKKFGRVDYLAKHKTIHTKVRAYKCPDCKHKFSRSDNFKVHLKKMHASDKTYSCLCGMKFSHKVLYSMHKNQHRGNVFICEFCQGKFKKFTEMKKHIKIDHLKMTKYSCEVCKKDFLKHNSLITHYDKRHKNISSICDVCGKEFESHSKLKAHKDAHELETSEKKPQPALKKGKGNKSTKTKILRAPPFECYHCKSSFKKIRLLKYHILTTHMNAKEFACNLCEQKFLTLVSLRNHYCISHKNENVICDKCGSHFKKYGDFLKHNRIHENGKVRKCDKCEKKFLTAAELKRHYLNTHKNL